MTATLQLEDADLDALMARYADGDLAAFDALYQSLQAPVRRLLWRLLGAEHKVNDAEQLTFMKLHVARETYQRGAPVRPWVLRIARNVALDHLRRPASRDLPADTTEMSRALDATSLAVHAEGDDEELIERVREAVDKLPPTYREVVRLHKLAELPMSDIAERLGLRVATARVRAHRGYKALAALMTEAGLGLPGRRPDFAV
jgi:RNA polymerase sigma-70 factor (ECF subfamily)